MIRAGDGASAPHANCPAYDTMNPGCTKSRQALWRIIRSDRQDICKLRLAQGKGETLLKREFHRIPEGASPVASWLRHQVPTTQRTMKERTPGLGLAVLLSRAPGHPRKEEENLYVRPADSFVQASRFRGARRRELAHHRRAGDLVAGRRFFPVLLSGPRQLRLLVDGRGGRSGIVRVHHCARAVSL